MLVDILEVLVEEMHVLVVVDIVPVQKVAFDDVEVRE